MPVSDHHVWIFLGIITACVLSLGTMSEVCCDDACVCGSFGVCLEFG